MHRSMRPSLLAPTLLALLFVVAGKASAQEINPSIFYKIKAQHSGKCLDVSGGPAATGNGARVTQWDCHDVDNQKWQLVPVGDGYYKILAKHSGKALDVFGGTISTANGVIVQQWDYNGAANQMWKLSFNRGDPSRGIPDTYTLIARHSDKVLDIDGGPQAQGNGAAAQQWADVGGTNQRWILEPLPGTGTAGTDVVSGTFSYTDSEGGPGTFNRPIAGCRVQIRRAGGLVATTETDVDGKFNALLPHMPDGTDTTVLVYATNAAAQVLASSGPYYVSSTRASRGNAPLDFSRIFDNTEQIRSFNAAHDIRLAYNYARARRDPSESEVIPTVDVSFIDHAAAGTRYNAPASGIMLDRTNLETDLVIIHEYAHFLEDKIGSFLLAPTYHDTCATTLGWCPHPSDCLNTPTPTDRTLLINSPENAWMEGFAHYFAMSVKRANPSERFNLDSHQQNMSEADLISPGACGAVGRIAFDGHVINGEMIEKFVASALWNISRSGDTVRNEEAIFQIFDKELDESASVNHALPNISKFHLAWVERQRRSSVLLGHLELDNILRVNIPTVVANEP